MSCSSNNRRLGSSVTRRRCQADLAHDRAGVTSLEWALVAATFMLLIVSIFDLVRYVVVLQSVAGVMTEVGRACIISAADAVCGADNAASWPLASTVAPMLDPAQIAIAVQIGSSAGQPAAGTHIIHVTISYPYQAMVPWLSSLSATISESATYVN